MTLREHLQWFAVASPWRARADLHGHPLRRLCWRLHHRAVMRAVRFFDVPELPQAARASWCAQ